ncbi:tyrosine-protein phosphatase siw14 [Fusarium equiseti]|uniref:diphosphoinositol-polyphosphate diphosphatase n=1 Tax=Fusarium equiseti TaxID=61235 RepID=A0ABQ8RCE6_FUSEQ|nr:tyrosine-protein phosphatase siw14 [Fusarium equiseti]
MASKRNSRAFVDESTHITEGQTTPNGTQFRSRHGSRSTSKDEVKQEMEEALSTMSRKPSFTAVAMEASLSTSTSDSDSRSSSIAPPMSADGRPFNFGVVVPGVYRSSFPKSHDFEYIKGLGLKTIVTLVKKDDLDHDLETFITREGIRQVVFNMKGTKKEAIPLDTMKGILNVVLDKSNYPLLIHCNHGKHRTGCVVGVVRKITGWDAARVVAEYNTYAEPKARECDVTYLEGFEVSSLVLANTLGQRDVCSRCDRLQSRTFFRAVVFSTAVLTLWFLSGSRLGTARGLDPL